MDEASFYTGLVADLYRPLRSAAPDPDPYARFIDLTGQPALELGCGDGDPILELRRRGLDVEGVDSSADMLAKCRRRADEAGIDVVLHHQRMEELDLPGRYRSIFLAGPTCNLLPDDGVVTEALTRIRKHLTSDGGALVPLFIPDPVPADQIGRFREAVDDDGAVLRFAVTAATHDEATRRHETMTRYERIVEGATEVVERPWVLHWHTPPQFRALADAAGVTTGAVLGADGQVTEDDDVRQFAFWLRA